MHVSIIFLTCLLSGTSEPKNVTATVTNSSAAKICWKAPGRGQGRAEQFVVSFAPRVGVQHTETKVSIRSPYYAVLYIYAMSKYPKE